MFLNGMIVKEITKVLILDWMIGLGILKDFMMFINLLDILTAKVGCINLLALWLKLLLI